MMVGFFDVAVPSWDGQTALLHTQISNSILLMACTKGQARFSGQVLFAVDYARLGNFSKTETAVLD